MCHPCGRERPRGRRRRWSHSLEPQNTAKANTEERCTANSCAGTMMNARALGATAAAALGCLGVAYAATAGVEEGNETSHGCRLIDGN